MKNEIHIGLNKKKLWLSTVLYGILAIGGFLFLFGIADEQDTISPMIIKVVGAILSLFFAIVSGTFVKRLMEPQSGLHLSAEGLDDRTSSISAGQIEWKHIKGIDEAKGSGKLIAVIVRKNEKILQRAKNSAIRRLMEQNIKDYGTAVIIDTSALNRNFTEIKNELLNYYDRYGKK